MRQKFKKCGNTVVISLSGCIVPNDDIYYYDYFDMDATAPKDVEAGLEMAAGGAVQIDIDSPGGNLFAGNAIYTALMGYSGTVKFNIRSLAASVASVIAMASAKEGNSCEMSPVGLMVIHNVQGGAEGDYREMEATAETLKTANKTIVAAYKAKTGMDESIISQMMDSEKAISAEEALKVGLIDSISFEENLPPTTSSMANALTHTAGKLMNLMAHLPPMLTARNQPPPAATDDDSLGYAQAALAIEQNRY